MVQYMHLTVKEFLQKPQVWADLLYLTSGTDWDANVSLLRSDILMLRWSTLDNKLEGWQDSTWRLIDQAMSHALKAENSSGKAQVALLDELDRIAAQIENRSSSRQTAETQRQDLHWSALMHPRDQACSKCPESFLTFAITRGLTLYVRAKIGNCIRLFNDTSKRNLLEYATFYAPSRRVGKETVVHLQMLALLLKGGVDPNENFDPGSPWTNILSHILQRAKTPNVKLEPWCLDTCKLFLMYGADPHVCISGLSVLEIFETAFPKLPEAEMQVIFVPPTSLGRTGRTSSFGFGKYSRE